MYLLDTNTCIRILNDTSASVVARLRQQDPSRLFLSTVVKAELLFGARKSRHVEKNLRTLARFFSAFGTVPFDDRSAEHYGSIRSELERAGTPIGPNDTLIASTARAHDLILVTSNTGEFSRIVGLRLEDWQTS